MSGSMVDIRHNMADRVRLRSLPSHDPRSSQGQSCRYRAHSEFLTEFVTFPSLLHGLIFTQEEIASRMIVEATNTVELAMVIQGRQLACKGDIVTFHSSTPIPIPLCSQATPTYHTPCIVETVQILGKSPLQGPSWHQPS